MTAGESDIVIAVLARLDALVVALDEDAEALGTLPTDMDMFSTMDRGRRVASRALLKSVEQTEDQLARFLRLLPALMLVDSKTWYAQDYAHFAEKLGLVHDSFAWTNVIKPRNRLVHDYPLEPEAQLDMLTQAYGAMALLRRTALAARVFVDKEGFARD